VKQYIQVENIDISEKPAASFRKWRQQVPPKSRCLIVRLHGVTSQKAVIFIVTVLTTLHFANTLKLEYDVNVAIFIFLARKRVWEN
jgi:hypothetical protein